MPPFQCKFFVTRHKSPSLMQCSPLWSSFTRFAFLRFSNFFNWIQFFSSFYHRPWWFICSLWFFDFLSRKLVFSTCLSQLISICHQNYSTIQPRLLFLHLFDDHRSLNSIMFIENIFSSAVTCQRTRACFGLSIVVTINRLKYFCKLLHWWNASFLDFF